MPYVAYSSHATERDARVVAANLLAFVGNDEAIHVSHNPRKRLWRVMVWPTVTEVRL